ncbi:MAG: sulfatase-like hydrolase/transferase [Henriciella sp.]
MLFVRACFAGLLMGLTSACSQQPEVPAPHIVVLIADDLGLDQAPCHSEETRMPYLQSLCSQAVVFDRVYTHPYCTASRAALMTGRHPFRHGADDVRMKARKLPLSEVTIAELIKQKSALNYQTAGFGKWHLADDENGGNRNPNLQGFDHFAGNPRQHHTYRYFDFEWFENGEQVGPVSTYKTTFLADQVIAYFQGQAGSQPQFTLVSFTSPHKPFHAPPEALHSFGDLPPQTLVGTRSDTPGPDAYRANRREPRLDRYYFAMLEALDTEIARLVETLTQETDRPIIFLFLGDNGSAAEVFAAVDGEAVRSKATLYDGGVRVPLMVWGEPIDRAGRSDQLLHLADLFPTLANLAGVERDEVASLGVPLDGVSFISELVGSDDALEGRDFVFFERGNDDVLPFAFGAVDRQGLKLILRDPDRETNYSRGQLVEIYDTEADPLEVRNLLETPCAMPDTRVTDLYEFIVSKAAQNQAHSDWFEPELYDALLRQSRARCAE